MNPSKRINPIRSEILVDNVNRSSVSAVAPRDNPRLKHSKGRQFGAPQRRFINQLRFSLTYPPLEIWCDFRKEKKKRIYINSKQVSIK